MRSLPSWAVAHHCALQVGVLSGYVLQQAAYVKVVLKAEGAGQLL